MSRPPSEEKSAREEAIFKELKECGLFYVDSCGRIWTNRVPKQGRWLKFYEDRWVIATVRLGSYLGIHWNNEAVYSHRFVYWWFNGPIPTGWEVDHKDNDKFNDHPLNLEAVPVSVNGLRRWERRPELRAKHKEIFTDRIISESHLESMKNSQQRRWKRFKIHASQEERDALREHMKKMNKLANTVRWGRKC